MEAYIVAESYPVKMGDDIGLEENLAKRKHVLKFTLFHFFLGLAPRIFSKSR